MYSSILVFERDPEFLKKNGCLEKVCDFCLDGRTVHASRLGYRITSLFVDRFLGRMVETLGAVFPTELLRPEKQDIAMFAGGVDAIVESQTRVARQYFEDGSVLAACPPIHALLQIMAHGSYHGKTLDDPEVRGLFTRECLLPSDWYRDRLRAKQSRDEELWTRHVAALEDFQASGAPASGIDMEQRLSEARVQLARVTAPEYLAEIYGTIGADPSTGKSTTK